jgi:hypothetical protein
MWRILFALWSVLACLAGRADAATIFDAQPAHPWNRLYEALQGTPETPGSRVQHSNGEAFPDDQKYAELVAALDAFIKTHAEKLIAAPVKRAVLQSLVWATFDQASVPTSTHQSERDQVARRCAEVIRRLALTNAEIDALPDNFAAAVKAKSFAIAFDPAHPDAAFLPPDLLEGPWVMMAGEWPDPAAVQHVRAVQGRSQFYVFIRLPGDRAATLAYLHELANFPQPYVWNSRFTSFPYAESPIGPNPALPQFPKGTAVALLRQMILPTDQGKLRITPITESLQLRVYTLDPDNEKCCDYQSQAFFVYGLNAAGLFQGRDGLVRSPFGAAPIPLPFEIRSVILADPGCTDCHGPQGVQGLNTYIRPFGPPRHTPWFEPGLPESEDRETLEWKQRQYTWGLLRGMVWAR